MYVSEIIKKYGEPYSEKLNIKLNTKKESEMFKWFLASILFSRPIREEQAIDTYRLFVKYKLTNPDKILKAGWDRLVEVLDEGHYTRYDFSTATKLLDIMKLLKEKYKGKITNIYKEAKDSKDLENRLKEFKGVGPTTVYIFLRELRYVWKKADPEVSEEIKKTAKRYKINLNKVKKNTKRFVMLECGLHRLKRML